MDFCQTRRPAGLGTTPDKLEATITRREATQAAAQQTTGEVLPEGRRESTAQIRQLPQAERAADAGVSRYTQQKLDHLARQRPELLARVRSGDLSVNRAFIMAGGDIERMSVPVAPDRLAAAIAKRYDTRQLAELVAALLKHLTGDGLDNAADLVAMAQAGTLRAAPSHPSPEHAPLSHRGHAPSSSLRGLMSPPAPPRVPYGTPLLCGLLSGYGAAARSRTARAMKS